MITGELKSQVDKIWESFWTGGVSNPLTVIEQFTYLLFIRRLDETQLLEEKKAAMIKKPIANPVFTEAQKELRWSSFKNKEPQTMFDLFNKPMVGGLSVFEHMKQVGAENGVFAKYMSGATFMIPNARLLDQVVQMIDKIKMEDRDTKGDLYEYLLSKIATAGTNGQFRTPRHIIKMMVDMVQPTKEDTICDPSAGSAGFLVAAGEYFHENHPEYFHDKDFREHYNSDMFTGIEFDNTMLRIGAMNLQLHGIENPNLIGKDSLSESNGDVRNQFSLILANPPFKGSLDYDGVESSILHTVKSKKTELLFLGLMLRMLTTGGRCAVIVPDGVLFGSSNAHKQIRKEIIENHKLDAVISMPSGVFKPYAGVSTAVLFFTKTGTGGTDKVWFYDMQADGYTLDDKRTETRDNDIPDIVSRYHNLNDEKDRKRTDKSFLVPFADIKANDWDLSINRYKEVVYDEVTYAKPAVIIQDIKNLQEENKKKLLILEELLK
ncbi:Type I restriction-modification system, DNA-methyltransferase subunit M [Flavobacterium enshiense DK69]|uniref:site-specific DNA-methyltransferase (adenine-specific) n=1 Tax=Flavobacterium enshiense DK69 TaxID=1107311 RepID=V6SCL7_9FLAO|nr:class I SAM-dependent DNA methyltransferase [Flavobacterium enshiense]ESU24356.1 Type I restriction-modification system, DNA-methyltransferase subunit M [Flavobacterium enshiense DK69]KGO94462.1 N-6 DNA methylase [Flavobacterium enshiense DK69]